MEYSSEKIEPRGEQKRKKKEKRERGLNGSQNKGRQPKTKAARRKMTQREVLLPADLQEVYHLLKTRVYGHLFLWLQKGSNKRSDAYIYDVVRRREGKERDNKTGRIKPSRSNLHFSLDGAWMLMKKLSKLQI